MYVGAISRTGGYESIIAIYKQGEGKKRRIIDLKNILNLFDTATTSVRNLSTHQEKKIKINKNMNITKKDLHHLHHFHPFLCPLNILFF